MAKDAPHVAASAESQAQSASGEQDFKQANKPEKKSDEIQFFDTTIAKLVERKNEETGETEWVEVMSDNLYPGEKLKRADDEEKAAEKAKATRKARAKANDERDQAAKDAK